MGGAGLARLQEKAEGRFIAVDLDALFRAAFAKEIVGFIESLGPSNPERTALVFQRAQSYFSAVNEEDIEAAIKPADADQDEESP